jgi:phosphatidylglycerophosphatase A
MASPSAVPERKHDLRDTAARLLATALGAGYSPVVPGTPGSQGGVVTNRALSFLPPLVQVAATLALFGIGIAASSRTAEMVGHKDPGIVVVDEVVGQWATFLFLPFGPWTAGLGFVLFRIMDVFKPWPARDLESLKGGLGIMADDLMAGVYANLSLRVILLVVPLA